jgi:hypothetical protein
MARRQAADRAWRRAFQHHGFEQLVHAAPDSALTARVAGTTVCSRVYQHAARALASRPPAFGVVLQPVQVHALTGLTRLVSATQRTRDVV